MNDEQTTIDLLDEIKNLEAQRDALFAAAVEFVRKVESGEARSVRSYAQFKQAIAKVTGEACDGGCARRVHDQASDRSTVRSKANVGVK